MNNSALRKYFICFFLSLLTIGSCNAQIFHKNPEKQLFGKTHGNKEVKVKEPRKVLRAKKKQEANDRKLRKNYEKSVKQSQKRTIDIQTPEVQARMKQNKKDYKVRDKEKRKSVRAAAKSANKKYN